MIIIPTKAIIIPTHTSEDSESVTATQYFDIVYYRNTGHSIVFHSMTTAIPLEELEPHIEQMELLKVSTEIHIPAKADNTKMAKVRTMSQQAHLAVRESLSSQPEFEAPQRLL